MKILLVHIYFTNEYNSGINQIAYSSYDNLTKLGNEVYFFSINYKPYYDEEYKFSNFFVDTPVKTGNKFYDFITHYITQLYNVDAENKMKELLDEIKPDIVHIHSIWSLSYSIINPIRKMGIPIIYTAHDISAFCPAAFYIGTKFCNECKGLNTLPCVQKKCIKNVKWRSLYFSIKAFIERLCNSQKLDYYLTVSENTKKYIENSGVSSEKIKVLPNFIANDYVENAANTMRNYEYFLYAGGNDKNKGIYTILEVAKLLPKELKIHLVGSRFDEKFEKYIFENNINNVVVIGKLSKEQMQEEYKNCISVIMPSEWFETFGMITIEAAVYSKPSIGSNIGGIPNVIDNNITGQLFEPKNVNQLKECILNYWNNRELAIEHGKNAREKALREYSEDKYFEELIKIYNNVINNKMED